MNASPLNIHINNHYHFQDLEEEWIFEMIRRKPKGIPLSENRRLSKLDSEVSVLFTKFQDGGQK